MTRRLNVGITAVVLACSLCGCGSGNKGVGVSGTVKLSGAALSEGDISFIPAEGTNSPTAGVKINNGNFQIPAASGLLPGKFRVEITSFQKTGKKLPTFPPDPPGERDEIKQVIPAKYNTQSELTAEIKTGQQQPLSFDLQGE